MGCMQGTSWSDELQTDFYLIMLMTEGKDALIFYYRSIFLANIKEQVYFCLSSWRTASEVDVTIASHLP